MLPDFEIKYKVIIEGFEIDLHCNATLVSQSNAEEIDFL